ncbi:MAG: beta-propeller fold lactonase family protein [Bacteroidota bacterium]
MRFLAIRLWLDRAVSTTKCGKTQIFSQVSEAVSCATNSGGYPDEVSSIVSGRCQNSLHSSDKETCILSYTHWVVCLLTLVLSFALVSEAVHAQYGFEQLLRNGEGDITGISNPTHVLVSPDNRYVYVAGFDNDAMAIFSRSETNGELTFQEAVKNGEDGVQGLAGVRKFAFSEDGRFVYAVAVKDNALTTFSRADDGSLTFISSLRDGENDVDGLGGAWALAVSPDGDNIYVAAYNDNAVSVFSVDSLSGQPTFEDVIFDTGVVGSIGDLKLRTANNVVISPDGRHVYITGLDDDGLSVFARDVNSKGRLTSVQNIDNWASFLGFGNIRPTGIITSQDGKNVYVSGFGGISAGNLTTFSRDVSTGNLSIQQRFTNDGSSLDDRFNKIVGFGQVSSVAITPDNRTVYTTNYENSDGVADFEMFAFQRNPDTGGLTADLTIRNGSPAIEQPNFMAFDSTGHFFYVVAGAEEALTTFSVFFPEIESISADQGFPGEEFTLRGTDFGDTQGNSTVTFDQEKADASFWSDTAVTVTVPQIPAGSYQVTININSRSNPVPFIVGEIIVRINDFSPREGKAGMEVGISGENFGNNARNVQVRLGNTEVTDFQLISPDSIIAVVPPGLGSGSYSWQVVVDGSPSPPSDDKFVIDKDPPLPTFSPGHLADEIATDGPLRITFDEELFLPDGITPLDGANDFSSAIRLIKLGSTEETVDIAPTYQPPTLTITASLEENTFYRLEITATALADACGNLVRDTSVLFTTGQYQQLTISEPSSDFLSSDSSLLLQVNDPALVQKATLYYRGICSTIPFQQIPLDNIFNEERSISTQLSNVVDPVGVEYFYQLTDYFARDTTFRLQYAYQFLEEGEDIDLKFGKTRDKYNTIAFPLVLDQPTVSDVLFDELGGYDKEKWRLFTINGDNQFSEYPEIRTIDPGQAQLLIVKDDIGEPLNSGSGHRVRANKTKPYRIAVHPGWNLIGNPAPFAIDWREVANDPANTDAALNDFVFQHSPNWNNSARELDKSAGGLVFVNETTDSITIPLSAKSARIEGKTAKPAKGSWEVALSVQQEKSGLARTRAGFGMHPDASALADRYDLMTPPALGAFLDIVFQHPDYFYPNFSKDIVPPHNHYIWDFDVQASESGLIKLTWDTEQFPLNDHSLLLVDRQEERVIDMRQQAFYSFPASPHRMFQIYYAPQDSIDDNLNPSKIHLQAAYPNPFAKEVTIPFTLPPSDQDFQVELTIYNTAGQRVSSLLNSSRKTGFHQLTWDGRNVAGNRLPGGIYFGELRTQQHGTLNIQRKRLLLLPE